jgi:DNA-directed RNA polymerase specialized sigma24 family protein
MPAHDLHERFLKHLPRIEAHAKFAFRHVGCPHARDDLEAETIALAWREFLRLVERGRAPESFITTLVMRCAQAARSGRRVAGGFKKREAMPQPGTSRRALVRIPFADAENKELGWLSDALREDARTPVPRRVAFVMDFKAWRAALTAKRRAMLDALAAGGKTCEVAQAFGVCPARVSQMRRELAAGWRAFRTG